MTDFNRRLHFWSPSRRGNKPVLLSPFMSTANITLWSWRDAWIFWPLTCSGSAWPDGQCTDPPGLSWPASQSAQPGKSVQRFDGRGTFFMCRILEWVFVSQSPSPSQQPYALAIPVIPIDENNKQTVTGIGESFIWAKLSRVSNSQTQVSTRTLGPEDSLWLLSQDLLQRSRATSRTKNTKQVKNTFLRASRNQIGTYRASQAWPWQLQEFYHGRRTSIGVSVGRHLIFIFNTDNLYFQ